MRFFISTLIAALLWLLPAAGAYAIERETPESPQQAEQTPTTVAGFVVALLGDSGTDGGVGQALKQYYERTSARPIWTAAGAATEAAKAASAEIARAGDYGLDSAAYSLPSFENFGQEPEQRARIELQMSRAVLLYARHALAGRVSPESVGHRLNGAPPLPDLTEILEGISASDDAAAYLRSLHPGHPQFEALRKKLLELRGSGQEEQQTALPAGPALRKGTKHAQVALLRTRLQIAAGKTPNLFDKDVEDAVKKFQRASGLAADGVVGNGTRRAMNGGKPEAQIVKILINMERWRWLPRDLGADAGIYVWANIPEYRVRIVKGGQTAFSERAIVGKVNKKTPVFSDEMEWIEFHPTWYVPNSIKVDDILPSLRRPTSSVMKRYNLRLNCGAHGRDPKSIDWNNVDIRKCSISQPPGTKSVLGDFKFKFPNNHDVYMHDTPTKGLFSRTTRTFSHGCIRIRNPRRMAEILLEHDKQMTPARVGEILAGPRSLHKEEFGKHVPVHITYFTAVIDDEGVFTSRPDIYGHDRRLAQKLLGKGHVLPPPPVVASSKRKKKRKATTASDNWWQPNYLQN